MVFSNREQLIQTFDGAREQLDKRVNDDNFDRALALSRMAVALAKLENFTEAEGLLKKALTVIDAISQSSQKAIALSKVASTMELLGQHDTAITLSCTALLTARFSSREKVFEVLQQITPILASIDEGTTLWEVFEVIRECNEW
jgi:tetratricopeptide (TPR) repeat protein